MRGPGYRPPFDDVRVRQALNYAVSKERIITDPFDDIAIVVVKSL